jgi:hypothetical protein
MSLTREKSYMVSHGSDTVEGILNAIRLTDYSALRVYSGTQTSVTLTNAGVSGSFIRDDSDTVSADNGGTVVVSTNGKRWKRQYNGALNVQWFGAVGDGVTDDTSSIQSAVSSGAGKNVYFPSTPSSYKITTEISVSGHTTITGDGRGTVIKLAGLNKSGFLVSQQDGVIFKDLFIYSETPGTIAYTGGINIYNSTKCKVLNVEFIGMSWAGVLLNGSSYCTVRDCRFSGWLGSIQDSADIMFYQNSNYNSAEGNHCYGGGDHGIMVYDPYTNSTPTGNLINANFVGQHLAYGVVVYTALSTTPAYDLRTIISNNVIYDILGSSINGSSGAGIYVQAGGGTIVSNNNVYNCCRSTTNFDILAMAGIAVQVCAPQFVTGSEVEIVVTGNHVDATRGPALWASASNRNITISNNNLRSTSTENIRGEAVILQNVDAVKFIGNNVTHYNPNFMAVKYMALDGNYSHSDISGNTLTCNNSAGGFLVTPSGSGSINHVRMAGNTVFGSLSNAAYTLTQINGLRFIGNHGESTGIVLFLSNCPNARLSANDLNSTLNNWSIIFSGSAGGNAGTIADESNLFNGRIENDPGTGAIIIQYGNTTPTNRISAVGDRIIQSVPAIGSPKGWRCTAAGTPGTYVSEGNL